MRFVDWKTQAKLALLVGTMALAITLVAGIGFAVAASDVKSLTTQTAPKATQGTRAKIAEM